MTTPDLKTCCQIYPPGIQKAGLLPDTAAGVAAKAVWDDFCEKAGGVDAVNAGRAKV